MGVFTREIIPATPASISILTPLTAWLAPERGSYDALLFWCVFSTGFGRLVVETSEDGINADAQEFHTSAATFTELQCSVVLRDSARRYYRMLAYSQNGSSQTVSFGLVGASKA